MARAKRTAPEPEEQSTALALPDTPVLVAAYDDAAQMEAILARIESEVRAVVPDLSTATNWFARNLASVIELGEPEILDLDARRATLACVLSDLESLDEDFYKRLLLQRLSDARRTLREVLDE